MGATPRYAARAGSRSTGWTGAQEAAKRCRRMSIEVVMHERHVMMRMLTVLLMMGAATTALRVEAADGVALYNAVRVAFYESAPKPIATSMRAAVEEVCSSSNRPGPDRA